jgi:hypothetical protein
VTRNSNLPQLRDLSAQELCAAFAIDSDAIRWFAPEVIAELAVLKEWIFNGELASFWQDVLKVLISSILHKRLSELREVHYTYIVDRSRTTRPPKRTVDASSEIIRKIMTTFIQFEVSRNRLERAEMMPALDRSDPTFITGSSDEGVQQVGPGIDLVVTSPPYFGMNDYVRSQYLTYLIFPDPNFHNQLKLEIGARRDRRSLAKLNDYLSVLDKSFKEIGLRVSDGGCLAVVLGTSFTSAASVRPQLEALESALRAAEMKVLWMGSRRVIYRKINNTPFREEHIWVLRKAD